ncbi:hypothetical protein DL769_008947 [Monosporascus sp. CRB-8-3]|nr:hypothetical protein DL769_008947 [Monosporascus sp. CRB-8-3]
MSQPTGGPIRPGPRGSSASSLPRSSQSQAPGDSYRLDIIYSPLDKSGLRPNVDIVAVHGLSEDADSTWVLTLPARTKGGSGSAPGKRDSSFIPTVESIKESGVVVSNFAGNLVKNTVTTATKQFTNQPQQLGDPQFGQQPTGETPRQDESRAKLPHVQSSNASSISDDPESGPSLPAKVNWLKDNNMLPRCFPRARIMQFSYPASLADTASNNLKAVASELLRRLSDERKDCGPGLSRPIIFIGHSFGGIVVSEALIMAKEGSHSSLPSATAGLVFCIGNTFSRIESGSFTAADKDALKVEIQVPEAPCVEVNAKDERNQSPLRHALRKSEYGIVRALLKRGASADDEDKEIASNTDARHSPDKSFRALLDNVKYFEGPRVGSKKQESPPKSDQDNVPEDCRSATGKFLATITTFKLRREDDSEDKIRDVARPDAGEESSVDEGEREYHIVETLPLSDLLYSGQKHHKPSEKEWTWYHLPANNMDWVEPQASVLKGNGRKDTVLFMPYLHFETNEGRIRLSNAIKRTAIDLAKPQKEDDATSVSAESDCGASTKALFTYDDDDLSESESDGDDIKEMADHKVKQLKAKFKSFRRAIRQCREALWEYTNGEPSEDDMLIKAYLSLNGYRLHIRRTLDQFYYIGMEDTESRDTKQVVQRYAVKGFDKIDKNQNDQLLQSKLIMVDQLWLWILGESTLITSFPQGWGRANGPKDDCDGVLEQIQSYLRKSIRNPITSVDALASVIIKECTRVFGRFQVPKPELQFLDFFDASISDVADRHSKIYAKLDVGWDDEEDFVKTGQKNQEDKSKKEKKKETKKAKQKAKQKRGLKGSQLHIDQEVELLVEIQDIRDELNIIKMVLDDQHSVLTVPDSEDNRKSAKSKKHILHATFPDVDGKSVDSHVNVNRKTIEHMISRAGDVYNAIYHLIDLKQKQANITEARYARKEAKSAAKEGRTILALTIVNMIFLPLSFMASFFSLDIAEFPKDPETGQTTLHLRWVAQYVFGISLAIAIPSIAVALAIGPMADFTKKFGRRLGDWGMDVLSLIAAVLLLVLMVALVPVAAGLLIAAGGVALAMFILYLVALIVFYMCRWIWRCTPWYRSREARKRRERLDPEVAVQNEGHESQVDGNNRNGEGEGDEVVDEKGTRVKERGPESQHDAGNGYEIEEAPQPTLI